MRRFAFLENLGFFDHDLRFSDQENMKFGLKWVHMARYELILRLDGALWLTIISKTPLTPEGATDEPNIWEKK